jgi:hypothetical protein
MPLIQSALGLETSSRVGIVRRGHLILSRKEALVAAAIAEIGAAFGLWREYNSASRIAHDEGPRALGAATLRPPQNVWWIRCFRWIGRPIFRQNECVPWTTGGRATSGKAFCESGRCDRQHYHSCGDYGC